MQLTPVNPPKQVHSPVSQLKTPFRHEDRPFRQLQSDPSQPSSQIHSPVDPSHIPLPLQSFAQVRAEQEGLITLTDTKAVEPSATLFVPAI
jgi:hypothetical protein